MNVLIKTPVLNSYTNIFKLFNLTLFKALSPPLTTLTVERFDGCSPGDEVHLEVKFFVLFKQRWKNKIVETTQDEKEISFTDVGLLIPFPLKTWKHIHRIEKLDETHSLIIDDIHYQCANKIIEIFLFPVIYFMFLSRRSIYQRELTA